jgi:exosortase
VLKIARRSILSNPITDDTAKNQPALWLGISAWLAITLGLFYLFAMQGNTDQPAIYGRSAIVWMVARWNWTGADMSYAWLIPAISLWTLWQRRTTIRFAARNTDLRGLAVVALGLLTYLVGIRTQQTRIVLMSFIMLLWGMPFFAFGWSVARQLIFPCAYLIFCIPFTFLDDLTLPLRLISTTVSSVLLNGLGISVTRIGTALHVNAGGGFSLDVAHPCSGLRYLLAMIALTTAYAYFTQRPTWRRLLLSMASVPLAMIGNIFRIFLIALVGVWFGSEIAVGFYHDYSGYVVFAVASALMMWTGGTLQRIGPPPGPQEPQPAAPPPVSRASLSLWPPFVMVLLVTGMALVSPALSSVYVAKEDTASISLELPASFDRWQGEDLFYCQSDQCARSFKTSELNGQTVCPVCEGKIDQVSIGERELLPADTRIARKIYQSETGEQIIASIVLTGSDQRSIHRPQQCLPAQGYAIANRSVLQVPLINGKTLTMTLMRASQGQHSPSASVRRMVLAYWFSGGGHITHDHLERIFWVSWDNLIHGYKARWAYVSLQTTESGASSQGAALLSDFARHFQPLIQRDPGNHR